MSTFLRRPRPPSRQPTRKQKEPAEDCLASFPSFALLTGWSGLLCNGLGTGAESARRRPPTAPSFYLEAARKMETARHGKSRSRRLFSALALLRDHQAARRGQQHDGEQAFLLQTQRRLAHDFHVRTGVVHQDQAVRVHLRQKMTHFLLAQRHVAVAE